MGEMKLNEHQIEFKGPSRHVPGGTTRIQFLEFRLLAKSAHDWCSKQFGNKTYSYRSPRPSHSRALYTFKHEADLSLFILVWFEKFNAS